MKQNPVYDNLSRESKIRAVCKIRCVCLVRKWKRGGKRVSITCTQIEYSGGIQFEHCRMYRKFFRTHLVRVLDRVRELHLLKSRVTLDPDSTLNSNGAASSSRLFALRSSMSLIGRLVSTRRVLYTVCILAPLPYVSCSPVCPTSLFHKGQSLALLL